jgi:hypothetical protein
MANSADPDERGHERAGGEIGGDAERLGQTGELPARPR